MNRLLAALLFTISVLPAAQAQTSSEATIQALLAEVRQLRLALERSAVMAPKIQVTLQRMQIQQDSVSRASRELEDLRAHLSKSAAEDASLSARIKDAELSAAREQDPGRRRESEADANAMKSLIEQQRIRDSQLRARESEMAGRLQTEQAKLDELNNRLNTLEQMLEAPQPKQP
jgi:hypothetical protein